MYIKNKNINIFKYIYKLFLSIKQFFLFFTQKMLQTSITFKSLCLLFLLVGVHAQIPKYGTILIKLIHVLYLPVKV